MIRKVPQHDLQNRFHFQQTILQYNFLGGFHNVQCSQRHHKVSSNPKSFGYYYITGLRWINDGVTALMDVRSIVVHFLESSLTENVFEPSPHATHLLIPS
jgi:hypothetical protein